MPFEHTNFYLFSLINATPNASHFSISLAHFIAQDLLYLLFLLLGLLWFSDNIQTKKRMLRATTFTTIALIVSFLISTLFYHPRPFAIPLGQNYLTHAANGSFPSDHMLIFSTVAWSYFFSQRKMIATILFIIGWCVAWSRVYLGVHFPFDMFGAFIISFILNWTGQPLWQKYGSLILSYLLKLQRILFKNRI